MRCRVASLRTPSGGSAASCHMDVSVCGLCVYVIYLPRFCGGDIDGLTACTANAIEPTTVSSTSRATQARNGCCGWHECTPLLRWRTVGAAAAAAATSSPPTFRNSLWRRRELRPKNDSDGSVDGILLHTRTPIIPQIRCVFCVYARVRAGVHVCVRVCASACVYLWSKYVYGDVWCPKQLGYDINLCCVVCA